MPYYRPGRGDIPERSYGGERSNPSIYFLERHHPSLLTPLRELLYAVDQRGLGNGPDDSISLLAALED